MNIVQIRKLALNDIQVALKHYDSMEQDLGDRFKEQLLKQLDLLAERPEMFQLKYKDTRICYLLDFPFGIHYLINGNTIEVLAVLHSGRNPEIWKDRNSEC